MHSLLRDDVIERRDDVDDRMLLASDCRDDTTLDIAPRDDETLETLEVRDVEANEERDEWALDEMPTLLVVFTLLTDADTREPYDDWDFTLLFVGELDTTVLELEAIHAPGKHP